MKYPLLLFYILLLISCTNKTYNLDFEKIENDKPSIWQTDNLVLGAAGYAVSLDKTIKNSGDYSIKVERDTSQEHRSFGVARQKIPNTFSGDSIIVYADIKTSEIEDGYAGILLRLDIEPGLKLVVIEKMENRNLNGTNDWKTYRVSAPLHPDAKIIIFGAYIRGEGTAWYDNFQVYIDDQPIHKAKKNKLPVLKSVESTQLNWLQNNLIPIKHRAPNEDYADLMPLKEIVGDAKIIALGEFTHGTSEVYTMKDRIFRFLVDELNFNAFGIEGTMGNGTNVNKYINNENIEIQREKLIRHLGVWAWEKKEVNEMVEAMKTMNTNSPNSITFFGVDSKAPFTSMRKIILKASEYKDSTLASKIVELANMNFNLFGIKEHRYDSLVNITNEIFEITFNQKDFYLSKGMTQDEYKWHLHHARLTQQSFELWNPFSTNYERRNNRDRFMAENVSWIMKTFPDTKIVLWAHNIHVENNFLAIGEHLKKEFGDDYISIGFCGNKGTYTGTRPQNGYKIKSGFELAKPPLDSYEYIFSQVNEDNFLLDLRKSSKVDPASSWLWERRQFRLIGFGASEEQFYLKPNLPESFDAIIYLDETSSSSYIDI